MLEAGYRLTDVTAALCRRWAPGVALRPVSDERHETHVVITPPGSDAQRAIHFQEWWVRYRAQVPTTGFAQVGDKDAHLTPEAAAAIDEADVILFAPSNPVVSIGAILSVNGMRAALRTASAPDRRDQPRDRQTSRCAGWRRMSVGDRRADHRRGHCRALRREAARRVCSTAG